MLLKNKEKALEGIAGTGIFLSESGSFQTESTGCNLLGVTIGLKALPGVPIHESSEAHPFTPTIL